MLVAEENVEEMWISVPPRDCHPARGQTQPTQDKQLSREGLGSPKWPEGLRTPGPGRERPGEAEDFVTEEVTGWIQKDGQRAGQTRTDMVTSVLSYLPTRSQMPGRN